MIASLAERILHLHGLAAVVLIFVLAALECSAFLGIIVPGEVAVIVGGVLAFQGRIPLWAAIVAAVVGAFDRGLDRVLHRQALGAADPALGERPDDQAPPPGPGRGLPAPARRLGRVPRAVHGGAPGARSEPRGHVELHYPTFLLFNVAGAVAWGTAFTLLGYFAGASWRQVERVASRTGLVLLGLVIVGFAVAFLVRRIRRRRSEPPQG